MHEVSIALGMADELIKIARDNNAERINIVKLKIGQMSGIVADSLIFAFDAIKIDYPLLSSAVIEIEEVPLRYECGECRSAFNADDLFVPSCPECGAKNLVLISGEEQQIENVEIEV